MTTKKRKFGGKTLAFLMVFYLLLGGVVFPELHKVTFDEKNPPPPHFPVVAGGDHLHPIVWDYIMVNEDPHYSLMTEEAEFEEFPINFSLKIKPHGVYELQAKTELYTQYHYYRIDSNNKAVPISMKLNGLIIWIWSLVCLVAMTVLIIIVKLIYLGWQKHQSRYDDDYYYDE